MYYGNEDYKKPEFDTLEITVRLTAGQSEIIRRYSELIEGIGGVIFHSTYWRDDNATLTFLAPKLSEILTVLKGIDINSLPEWERRNTKNILTRTVNALEKTVSEKWARVLNGHARKIADLRNFTEEKTPVYEIVLETLQYGFKWEAHQDGRNAYFTGVTIAPVPFISLDGTPTIEWVCDTGGMYLTFGGKDEERLNAETRYGTLETALERGKAMMESHLAERAIRDEEARQTAIAKLAEIEVDAFIKVQAIA